MDGVHFAWERAPYQLRWQYIGKEGYPTIVVNLHCTATGWIKYATTIFAGATNDKTIVRSDDLVSKMKTDPLFLERRWPTSAKDPSGSMHELEGCMTLCDSGYHNHVHMYTDVSRCVKRWNECLESSRSGFACSNCL
jgi:hypothetical protein